MITAIEKNLKKGIKLLQNVSNDDYTNSSIPPYYSTIGCHVRHILDIFSCVFNGLESKTIDFTNRERNELVESYITEGLSYFDDIITKLNPLTKEELEHEVLLTDNLGLGNVTSKTALKAVLMQVQSHTTHHYESIGYLIYQLGIELPDSDFGFNPITPKKVIN